MSVFTKDEGRKDYVMVYSEKMAMMNEALEESNSHEQSLDNCSECNDVIDITACIRNEGRCDRCAGARPAPKLINGKKILDHAMMVMDQDIIRKQVPEILKELVEMGSTEETIIDDFAIAMQSYPRLAAQKEFIGDVLRQNLESIFDFIEQKRAS
jgi:ferredoxin